MNLPAEKGVYALVFDLPRPIRIMVGKLGKHTFELGQYIYLGSAHGNGGLGARLRHHLRQSGKAHWHIDALSQVVCPSGFYYTTTDRRLECVWCQQIQRAVGAYLPVIGFGASDCHTHCGAHLVGFRFAVETDALRAMLEVVTAHEAVVYQAIRG